MNSSSWFFLCNNVHCITHALPWTHLNSPRSPFCVCWPILFVPLLLAHFLWDFSCWKIRKFIDFMAFTHFIAFNKWPSLCQSTLRWATHLLLRYLVWFVDLLPVAQILPFLYFWLFWYTLFLYDSLLQSIAPSSWVRTSSSVSIFKWNMICYLLFHPSQSGHGDVRLCALGRFVYTVFVWRIQGWTCTVFVNVDFVINLKWPISSVLCLCVWCTLLFGSCPVYFNLCRCAFGVDHWID